MNWKSDRQAETDHARWRHRQRRFAYGLFVLCLLFLMRVLAQLTQAIFYLPWLPPFEMWHSGVLPYGLLLTAQAVILVAMIYTITSLMRGAVRHSRKLGRTIRAIGAPYLILMMFRLIAGQTFLSTWPWFAASLPAVFHLVLAGFLILFARLHLGQGEERC